MHQINVRYGLACVVFAITTTVTASLIFYQGWHVEASSVESFRGGSIHSVVVYDAYQIADQLAFVLLRNPDTTKDDFNIPDGWHPPADWEQPEGFQPPEWWK